MTGHAIVEITDLTSIPLRDRRQNPVDTTQKSKPNTDVYQWRHLHLKELYQGTGKALLRVQRIEYCNG